MTKYISVAVALIMICGCNAGGGGPAPAGTMFLETVTFEIPGGFPQGQADVDFQVGGAAVNFSGGVADTRGVPPLYGEGLRSWMIGAATGTARIDLSNLEVDSARFYFVHSSGGSPATLTFADSGGGSSEPIQSVAVSGFFSGQAAGFMTIDAPEGETITEITIEPPTSGEAAFDTLRLAVPEAES